MIALFASDEAHHDKTRQRYRFEKTATGRLNLLKYLQRSLQAHVPGQADDRVPCRMEMVADLANGDQRRKRIADHLQVQPLVPLAGHGRQLKRQLRNLGPGLGRRAKPPRQRQHRQNRNRKRPILSVKARNRFGQGVGFQIARFLSKPRCSVIRGASVPRRSVSGKGKNAPAERGRTDVADAENSVSPAAIVVLGVRQPIRPPRMRSSYGAGACGDIEFRAPRLASVKAVTAVAVERALAESSPSQWPSPVRKPSKARVRFCSVSSSVAGSRCMGLKDSGGPAPAGRNRDIRNRAGHPSNYRRSLRGLSTSCQ